MQPFEIQTAALECLDKAKVHKVLRTTIYSLSAEPEDEVFGRVGQAGVLVHFVADYDDFMVFRSCVNDQGVWVSARWKAFGRNDMFVYECFCTEKW